MLLCILLQDCENLNTQLIKKGNHPCQELCENPHLQWCVKPTHKSTTLGSHNKQHKTQNTNNKQQTTNKQKYNPTNTIHARQAHNPQT